MQGEGMNARKLLFVMIIVILWEGHTYAQPPIKIGYFMLPPHQYLDKNKNTDKPQGASVKYFEIAAAIMGEQVEWVGPLPLLRLSENLKTGQLDGTVGFNRTPRSEAYLYYTASPVFLAQPVLMVRQDNPITEIRTIDDIQGYRIGLITTSGGLYTPLLDRHRHAITLERLGGARWAEQNIRKLLLDRLDAVFDRQPYTLPFVAAGIHQLAQVKVLPIPDPPTPMYVVFAKASQRGKELVNQYNAIIPKLKVNYTDLAQQELDAATSQQ